jgi:hypothetical protein
MLKAKNPLLSRSTRHGKRESRESLKERGKENKNQNPAVRRSVSTGKKKMPKKERSRRNGAEQSRAGLHVSKKKEQEGGGKKKTKRICTP